jgi:hypothetical protein
MGGGAGGSAGASVTAGTAGDVNSGGAPSVGGAAGTSGSAGFGGALGVGGTATEGGMAGEGGFGGEGVETGGTSGTGAGGSSGAGGDAGTTGAGGSTGSGGMAGGAGTAGSGGTSGNAGTAGSGGASGSAGASGTAGQAGGGTAGAGGATNGCVTGSVRVDYAPGSTNGQIEYDINVTNLGSTSIRASDIEVRYYFTQENPATPLVGTNTVNQLQNPYNAAGGGQVTSSVVAMSTPTATADHYLRTTFAGANPIAQNQYLTFKTYYQPMNQTQSNDYSFGTQATKVSWNKIVVFVANTQQWGCTP